MAKPQIKHIGIVILILSLLTYAAYMILCIVNHVQSFGPSLAKIKTGDTLAGCGITAGIVGIAAAAISIGVFTVKFVAEGYFLVLWIFLNIAAAFLSGFAAALVVGIDFIIVYTQYSELIAQLCLAVIGTGLLVFGNVISYLPKKSGYLTID